MRSSSRRLASFVFLVAGCLAAAVPLRAQIRVQRNLTVAQGLVQSQVVAVAEDREGYLWFGTLDGASRFDGSVFTNFQSREGLPAGPVFAVLPTQDGSVILGTERGARVYRRGKLEVPPGGLGMGPVRALAETPAGDLLFARPREVVALHRDGRVERLPLGDIMPRELLAARDGTVVVGTDGQGALVLRDGRVRRLGRKDGLPGEQVLALAEGRDGRIYLGTEGGLAVWHGRGLAEVPGVSGPIQAIEEGADGTLYVGTAAAGLLLVRRGPDSSIDAVTTNHGLAWNGVQAVHETRDGAVYVGTGRGVSVYGRDVFQSWTRDTGLPDDLVWSLAEDGHGGLWMGTGRGLAHLRDGRWTVLGRRDGLPDETVRALLVDSTGRLWAGTQQGGLAVVREEGRFQTFDRRNGLADDFVRAFWEAPGGAVWIGTENGLSVFEEERLRTVAAGGLPAGMVTSIAGGPEGAVWLGTAGGLVRSWNGSFQTWTERDGLADDMVWSVRVRPDGTVLAGTARGLSIFRGGRFRTVDARRGLTNDTVYCILEDDVGLIYLSTNRGVDVLDLGRPDPVVRVLQREDGLADNEGNLGACHRDSRGLLWFGNVAGVSRYDPGRDRPARTAPRIHIAGLRLFGKEMPLTGAPRTFESQENYFDFSFLGIDLAAPHAVRYRYRLAGLDRSWTETDRRSVQYTNLDPGAYRFEVQAASSRGVWSPAATLPFTIRTPLWRRWWVVLLAVLAVGSGVAFAVRLRVRQLLAIERLRTALAADLHDHIGAGLTEIAILSEIATYRANGGGPPAELTKIADTARQLVDKMNDIVWLVNPRRDSLHELFLRLKDSYSELFSHAGVLFRTTNLRLFEHVRLPMAYRENLYLIFKEALHNSLRHSGCQEIELSIALQGRRLEVVLQDDGRGFDPGHNGHGNGLENMQARATRIGGRLSIDSVPGGGTAVRFVGPLA